MAVIKAKPQKVVEFFLGLLERALVTPFVVTRVGQDFFKGAQNDTVSLRLAVRVKPWIRTTVSAASVAARSMLRKLVAVGASGFFMRRSWVRPRTTASRLLR